MENSGVLYPFIQFKLLAPNTIKKCININNEEKLGQTIFLDKYNSRDFSNVTNIIHIMEAINIKKMENNKNFTNNLNIFVEKNKLIRETHNRTLTKMNSWLNNK